MVCRGEAPGLSTDLKEVLTNRQMTVESQAGSA